MPAAGSPRGTRTDLNAILACYEPTIRHSSPFIKKYNDAIGKGDEPFISGLADLGGYFSTHLQRSETLRFEPKEMAVGLESVILTYRRHSHETPPEGELSMEALLPGRNQCGRQGADERSVSHAGEGEETERRRDRVGKRGGDGEASGSQGCDEISQREHEEAGRQVGSRSLYFPDRAALREWLREHHASHAAIWLVYDKKHVKGASTNVDDIVEEALCFGWIDSVTRGVDDKRSSLYFSPRKPGSTWSAVNKKRLPRLIEQGLMHPAGRGEDRAQGEEGRQLDNARRDREAGRAARSGGGVQEEPESQGELRRVPARRPQADSVLDHVSQARKDPCGSGEASGWWEWPEASGSRGRRRRDQSSSAKRCSLRTKVKRPTAMTTTAVAQDTPIANQSIGNDSPSSTNRKPP